MFKCGICRKNIKNQNLRNAFQFTLGNMKSGKFFYENLNVYYYHVDCLTNVEKPEKKILISLT
jgi:hypothetical protein